MIRGITFDKQLFKSGDFALMDHKYFGGNDGIVKGCTLGVSGMAVTISPGWFIASGYYTQVETQESIQVDIDGYLVYEIDLTKTNTTTSFNQGAFKIITSTPVQQDLFNGGTLYQLPVARVTTNGFVVQITQTLWGDIRGDYQSQIDGLGSRMTSVENSVSGKFDKNHFAILTGTISVGSGEGTSAVVNVNYPNGFTKNNTAIISLETSNGVSGLSTDLFYPHPSMSMHDTYARLKDDVIMLTSLNKSQSGSLSIDYKLVLINYSQG